MNELCDRLAQAFFALTDDSVGGNGGAVGRLQDTGVREIGVGRHNRVQSVTPSFGIDRDALLSHSRSCPRCQSIGVALAAAPSVTRVRAKSAALEPPARVWASIEASLRTEGIIRDAAR